MEAEARIRELKIQKLEIDRAERMGQLMHTELVQTFITDQMGAWRIELEPSLPGSPATGPSGAGSTPRSKRSSTGSLPRPRALMAKLAVEEAEGAA